MIRFKEVSFQYKARKEGVKNLTFHIKKGECAVFIGPSGGGKSTVLRLMNALAPDFFEGKLSGEIALFGKDRKDLALWEVGKEIGSVFQDPKSQFFSADLAGEVAFGCENYGLPQKEIRKRTDEAIRKFGLECLRNRPLDVLSSGEKQRTAIASVYALGPHTYVCDEPTANLDEAGCKDLARSLKELKKEGKTIILAEHRLSWLMDFADRFFYVREGEIRWEKSKEELLALTDAERKRLGLREFQKKERKVPDYVPVPEGTLLEARSLTFKRGRKKILRDVNLSLKRGEILALTGVNGAGKTTLAMVLSGLLKESGGDVRIDGKGMSASLRRKQIWYGSNDTGTQFFTDSVTDELLLGKNHSEEALEEARSLLKRLGLYDYREYHPASLSGGQKQRLSIACGIFSNRPVLIFDEPTSGLDGGNMELLSDLFEEQAGKGKAILVITHDTEWINRSSTAVFSLKKVGEDPATFK